MYLSRAIKGRSYRVLPQVRSDSVRRPCLTDFLPKTSSQARAMSLGSCKQAKFFPNASEAVKDVHDGSKIMFGGK